MSLLTRQPDGSLLIEGRVDYFLDAWRMAPQSDRLVLSDLRPAVRRRDPDGSETYLTIHQEAWQFLRRSIKDKLAAGELRHPNRSRLCQLCACELRLDRELEQNWVFHCPACHTVEIHDKTIIGGTRGAGEKEKV